MALALFSFAMTALISRAVFDRLPHLEDEMAYVFQAQVFARGEIIQAAPEPAQPFWRPFVLTNGGLRFSKYTPGWSAWLALGVNMGQMWVINAFFAMLTVALIYRLGRAVFNRDVGLIAAALLAFSPIALLLSGTLMGHTAALFFVVLFAYAYWRFAERVPTLRWGVVAGFALGMLVMNRPLSAIAVSVPFIVWSVIRLAQSVFSGGMPSFWRTLKPLLALSVVTVILSLSVPIYNTMATGDPFTNLYTLVWDYDKVGFGEGYGRSGAHSILRGVQYARYDLSLLAADLFGWQLGAVDSAIQQYLAGHQVGDWVNDAYYPRIGLSFLLLLPGILLGFRKPWALLWGVNVIVWLAWMPSAMHNSLNAWLMMGAALVVLPLIFVLNRREARWTWLLLAVAVSLVTVHFAYWIGSQRYSTRYYFEMVFALALLSAVPVAWVMQRFPRARMMLYAGLAVLCLWSLAAYSIPRIDALRGYNRIDSTLIEAVNARRTTDQPVLVLVTGVDGANPTWRSYGALMGVTGAYLDTDIVAAWDNLREGQRKAILALFPDREVIELVGLDVRGKDAAWFLTDCPAHTPTLDACQVANPPRTWE